MARSTRRRGRRIRLRQPVFFQTSDRSGSGMLTEVSYSGARIEADDAGVVRGERVRLYVWPAQQAEPFELSAAVANVREDGFAIEYERADQVICQWVDALPHAEPEPAQGSEESAP